MLTQAEKLRVAEQEKERQKRAKAFLERELKAKERAEAALKQLQREKAERIRFDLPPPLPFYLSPAVERTWNT